VFVDQSGIGGVINGNVVIFRWKGIGESDFIEFGMMEKLGSRLL
jgi:hypothetical protein